MAHIETRVLRPTNPSGALSASGGAANRIAVFSGTSTLGTSSLFTYNTSTESFSAGDTTSVNSFHNFYGRSLVLTYGVSGGVAAFTVYNTSNTASSAAIVNMVVQGGTAADPVVRWTVFAATDWSMGIDNSDSDSMKLSYGTLLGANDFWTVTSAGKHVIGVAGGAQFHEVYGRGLNVAYGTAGVTAYVQAAHSSNSAGSGVCYYLQVAGASASDPFMTFDVATTTQWSIGLDNSNSDCFSISKSYSLGTNEYLNISTAGLFTFSNSGVIRYDQNAATRLQIRNDDTGAGAYTQLKLSTDSGDVNLTANSAAAGDSVSLTADSTFGGGMDVGILGSNAIRLNTNSVARLTISGSGDSTFSGPLSVEAGTGGDTMFRVRGNSQTTGVIQFGSIFDTIFSSSATTGVFGIASSPQLANAAFTCGYAYSFYAGVITPLGGTATLTRAISFFATAQTNGTNNASIADNVAFSGNWFINSTSASPSSFGGQVRVASLGVANSAAATTLGTVTDKIEVFDASGASLGFVPVYDAIT